MTFEEAIIAKNVKPDDEVNQKYFHFIIPIMLNKFNSFYTNVR